MHKYAKIGLGRLIEYDKITKEQLRIANEQAGLNGPSSDEIDTYRMLAGKWKCSGQTLLLKFNSNGEGWATTEGEQGWDRISVSYLGEHKVRVILSGKLYLSADCSVSGNRMLFSSKYGDYYFYKY